MSDFQIVEIDGKNYYYDGKYFFDEFFIVLQGAELKEVAGKYFSSIDWQTLNVDELLDFIKKMKNNGLCYQAKKTIYSAMFKFKDDANFLYAVLPLYTSCCREMNLPQEAVDVAEGFLPICGGSVALYTSLAAAYCDLKNYEKAKKYARIAYAKQGGSKGYKNELSLLFLRLQKETGEKFFEEDD